MPLSHAIAGTKGFVRLPLERRFLACVRKTEGCWIWTATLSRGYGRIKVDGKQRPASQVAWELHHGKPFPAGMDVCHTCDNPPCVRPDHIFPGTPVDNAKDALAKCRLKCGRVAPLKSHCKHGHGFTDDNTLVRATTGHRSCRTCRDLRNWRRYGGL